MIILFVAFTYAELGAMFPESGGAVRYGALLARLTGRLRRRLGRLDCHRLGDPGGGRGVGSIHEFLASGSGLSSCMCTRPTGRGELTVPGLSIAAVLVVIYFLLNFWSVKVFADTNSAITFFKLVVPAATAGRADVVPGFIGEKFSVGVHGGEHVGNLAAILTAVATSGIIFSFNGFQNPASIQSGGRGPQSRAQRAVRHFRLDRTLHPWCTCCCRWPF